MRENGRRRIALIILCMLTWLLPVCAGAEEDALGLYARSAVLMDGDSGRILYGKAEDDELPMASTTKIMTCIVALEEADADMVCTVSGNASAQPAVKLGMIKDDEFYLGDLLYSLMLESHNDAAVCIAENVGGSVEGFADMMNAKAREIGCEKTYYITPNGLDAQDETGEHHTTAGELALVMRYCLTQSPKTAEFLKITQTPAYSFTNIKGNRSYSCTNHNAFLTIMDGALSGKTGFTGKAGYCYVGAMERDDKLLIVALLACGWPNHKGYKWIDTKKLMNYGLENYEKREITDSGLQTDSIPVLNGQMDFVTTSVQQDHGVQILMRPSEQVRTQIELEDTLEAPVKKGQQVGIVRYLLDGAVYVEYPVTADKTVQVRGYRFCLQELIGTFLL